jgi:hypothetical protein
MGKQGSRPFDEECTGFRVGEAEGLGGAEGSDAEGWVLQATAGRKLRRDAVVVGASRSEEASTAFLASTAFPAVRDDANRAKLSCGVIWVPWHGQGRCQTSATLGPCQMNPVRVAWSG